MDLAQKCVSSLLGLVAGLLQEGRGTDLGNCGSLSGTVRQQADYQVLEALTEVHTINGLEVRIISLLTDHLVVLVLEDLGAVGELTLDNDEEKNAH